MARKPKDSVARSFRLERDVAEWLEAYNEESGVPMTVIVEKALKEYLEKKYPEYKGEHK